MHWCICDIGDGGGRERPRAYPRYVPLAVRLSDALFLNAHVVDMAILAQALLLLKLYFGIFVILVASA